MESRRARVKVAHQSASISFCMDLTDPEAVSIPIAHLLVASAEQDRFAVIAALTPKNPKATFDPITADVLSDATTLIRDHVDRVLAGLAPGASLELILTGLHSTLRNSLHVANIGDVEVAEVGAPAGQLEAEEAIMDELTRMAVERMHQEVKAFIASAPPPPKTNVRAAPKFTERVPSRLAWPLSSASPVREARL